MEAGYLSNFFSTEESAHYISHLHLDKSIDNMDTQLLQANCVIQLWNKFQKPYPDMD